MMESRTGANGFKGCGRCAGSQIESGVTRVTGTSCFMSSYQRMLVSRAGAEGPDDGIRTGANGLKGCGSLY